MGKGVAHDEYIEFDLRSEQVYINSESFVFNGVLSVEFIKVAFFKMYTQFFFLFQLIFVISDSIY